MIKYHSIHFALEGNVEVLPDAEITIRYIKDGKIFHGTLFFPIKSTLELKNVYSHSKDFVKSLERKLAEKKDE